jgi:hypothetical protein
MKNINLHIKLIKMIGLKNWNNSIVSNLRHHEKNSKQILMHWKQNIKKLKNLLNKNKQACKKL